MVRVDDHRCASAPAIPPEGDQLEQERSPRTSRKTLLKSYTLDGPLMDDQLGASISKPSKPKARVSLLVYSKKDSQSTVLNLTSVSHCTKASSNKAT